MSGIKLSLPEVTGKEMEFINRAFQSGWIVPLGPEVDEFEHRLEQYLGAEPHTVVALSAGTAALHLALVLAGVRKDSVVICQSMTFAASAFPITYQGAKPVFVDSEPSTWNMDPEQLIRAIDHCEKKPQAIVAVDLYGMPAMWDEIRGIVAEKHIALIEDSAEALGSEYDGKHCGFMGQYGVLSFNGNKIITTSGGGALICPNVQEAKEALFLATQAREDKPYYYHEKVGYNYRMSNISAAIGCGQIQDLQRRVDRRRQVHDMYLKALQDYHGIQVHDNPTPKFNSNFWLTTILLPEGKDPVQVRDQMMEREIETRLLWRPMHMQPVFHDAPYFGSGVSENLFSRGLCLPSSVTLTNEDVNRVVDELKKII